uniref:Uncharacterized protein n=1 Tax=Rhizophora mucronata TaxID=61149 RepID=A0A2P2Q578_RHIMU
MQNPSITDPKKNEK